MNPIIPADARRIAPGVYDHEGTLHLDIPELLEANGLPDTLENREVLAAAALRVVARCCPEATITIDDGATKH